MSVRAIALVAITALMSAGFSAGLSNDDVLKAEGYIRPSSLIEDAALAPWHLNVTGGSKNASNEWMIVNVSGGLTPLAWLGAPHYNLGGIQVDSVAMRDRNMTMRGTVGLDIMKLSDGSRKSVSLPANTRVWGASWSPDGTKIAFVGMTDTETALFVYDVASENLRKLTKEVKMTEITSVQWFGDSARVAVPVTPQGVSAPKANALPMGPKVRTSDDKPDSLRTYAGLLQTPEDTDLLRYLLTVQIGVVDVKSGQVKRVGEPKMLSSFDPDPSGTGYIVQEFEGEFTYLNPAGSGARKQTLWNADGKEVALLSYSGQRKVQIKADARPPQRQGLSWRPDGAGLSFIQDEKLPKDSKDKPKKQLMLWKAPFGENDATVVYQAEGFSLAGYGQDGQTLFINTTEDKKTITSIVNMGSNAEPKKVWETSSDTDFYKRPGTLVFDTKPGYGRVVKMSRDGNSVFLSGTQYDKKPEENAPRPFIDELKLDGEMKPTRIFMSSAEKFEDAEILDADGKNLLITRQSLTEVPQLINKMGAQETQITQNKDYAPDITQAERKRIRVKRADGFEFWVTATLPKYTTSFSKLPAFFWFYPNEFTDQKNYDEGQRTYNKNRFPVVRSSSADILVRAGYVVVDPDCPIVGATVSDANNLYVHQLRMNLSATIDALADQGWVDRNRLAIGGHSYGAFSAANALIHTPFFKAGIGGDGNYNRSLTPFGFQSEPRLLWGAREVYQDISALWNAEKMTGAYLMYHGMEDQNLGTDPINSERMFQVLEALGKPAALYMYPFEDHGQIGKETRLDMWARWEAWLDKWVKNPESDKKEEKKDGGEVPPFAAKIDFSG
ncbi:MAG: S9 family peptidase [Fimbriimonadaceae bacterium]|nr:MAG: S9 family peptidase [Fimbriimonadaceae bacterium]